MTLSTAASNSNIDIENQGFQIMAETDAARFKEKKAR